MKFKIHALAISAALAWVTGCTSGSDNAEREYALPNSLCGVEIDTDLYAPIFPSGEAMREDDYAIDRGSDYKSPNGGCSIKVDGKSAIHFGSIGVNDGRGVDGYIDAGHDWLRLNEAESIDDDKYEIAVWPDTAVAHAPCVESETGNTGVHVSILLSGTDGEDFSEDLKRIIKPYAEGRLAQIDPRSCTTA